MFPAKFIVLANATYKLGRNASEQCDEERLDFWVLARSSKTFSIVPFYLSRYSQFLEIVIYYKCVLIALHS